MGISRRRAGWSLVLAAVLLFAAAVTAENRTRYMALKSTFSPDLGSFHNQAVNQAYGRDVTYLFMAAWFKAGDFDGPSVFRSAHFSPLRTLLLPQLYRLWPRIETLMLLQGLLIGLGAFGLYGLALDKAHSPGLGLLLAASYLLHPAILHTACNDLREITLGIGPALVALWLYAAGRSRWFALAALLALSARSEYVLLVAAIPLLALRVAPPGASRRVAWWLPVALALAWGGVSESYYRYFYGVSWPLLVYAIGHSEAGLAATLSQRLVPFFELMLLPAVLAVATPEVFLMAMPFVALARRVHALEFPPHHLQHLAPAMVLVFWGFALSALRIWGARPRWRRPLTAALTIAAALGFGYFSVVTWLRYPRDLGRFARIARWADGLPVDATVVVDRSLCARFSGHLRVLDYENLPMGSSHPSPEQAQAALAAALASADLVATRDAPQLVAQLRKLGLFEPPQRFKRYLFFFRKRAAPRVEHPDETLQRALLWQELPPLARRGASLAAAHSTDTHSTDP